MLLKKFASLFLFLFILSCSGGNDGSSGGDIEPFPDQELSGVWLGYFVNTTGVDEQLVSIIDTTFTVGVITQDGKARFIGNDTQFIADGVVRSITLGQGGFPFLGQLIQGELDACTWNTTGPNYSCDSDLLEDILGGVTSKFLLAGLYTRGDYPGVFSLTYNTTYEISPNVRDLEGSWISNNVFNYGNTLTLTIIPDPDEQNTTNGTITGIDAPLGNVFDGEIEIHYSTNAEDTENVYDVTLRINGGDDLTGLATIVQEMNTEGLEIPKRSIAIGVSNPDLTYMISVLSTFGE